MSWVTTIEVTPFLSPICLIRRSTAAALMGSSPVTGSSYSRISGRPTIARARPTRLRMPPDSSEGSLGITTAGSRLTSSSAVTTRASTSCLPRSLAMPVWMPKATFS